MIAVAAVRTGPETVLADIERACALAHLDVALVPAADTLVFDAMWTEHPEPGANTTPWQLDAAIAAVRRRSSSSVVHASTGADATGVLERVAAARAAGALDATAAGRTLHVSDLELGALERQLPDGVDVLDDAHGRNIVVLPAVRRDDGLAVGAATAAVALAVLGEAGRVLAARATAGDAGACEALVDAVALHRELHPGAFVIADATTVGNRDAGQPSPVIKNAVFASADPIALDAVVARIMGFDPLALHWMYDADRRGIGCARSEAIDVVGDVAIASERWGLARDPRPVPGALGRLRAALARSSVGEALARAGDHYRTYLWPVREGELFDAWCHDTVWGQLFADYRAHGPAPAEPS